MYGTLPFRFKFLADFMAFLKKKIALVNGLSVSLLYLKDSEFPISKVVIYLFRMDNQRIQPGNRS